MTILKTVDVRLNHCFRNPRRCLVEIFHTCDGVSDDLLKRTIVRTRDKKIEALG